MYPTERSDSLPTSQPADRYPPDEPASNRTGDRALVGCLYVAGGFAIVLFLYLAFFVFAVLDDRNEWGLLEPYLDERTSEILYVIYFPLIHFYLWLALP